MDRPYGLMSDTDQHESKTQSAGGSSNGSGDHIPVSKFEVVPFGKGPDQKELFSYRELAQPVAAPVPAKSKTAPPPLSKILVPIALLGVVAVLLFILPRLFQPKAHVSTVDLGSQRLDAANLSGRLVARWDTSGSYQLYIDPIGAQATASFASAAVDPPNQLSITIRLLDAAGLAVCQKQILFPAPAPHAPADTSSPQPAPAVTPAPQLGPQQTDTGDTIQNMTGANGQITEIDLRGPLPCSAEAYASVKTWDFAADFPTSAEEDAWLRQEKQEAKDQGAKGKSRVQIARLAGPLEGDDVIVGDNPSHGTVETSGGRVFFLGAGGMRSRTGAWQVFPAPIHFHCDKNGSCALTRSNSPVSLQARLVK